MATNTETVVTVPAQPAPEREYVVSREVDGYVNLIGLIALAVLLLVWIPADYKKRKRNR